MEILVANNQLKNLGGSETFTYTLAKELRRQGHEVDVFTNVPGLVSSKLEHEKFKVFTEANQTKYDLVLASHKTCVEKLSHLGYTIQTVHGTTPKLEQPNLKANYFVAISEEIKEHLKTKHNLESQVILNGIDCERFKPTRPINQQLKKVLSLSQSDELNQKLKKLFNDKGIEFTSLNKFANPVWNVEDYINDADLVVSLGRGAYEAMACSRLVFVWDHRRYQLEIGDGIVTLGNIDQLLRTNCSGRYYHYTDLDYKINEVIDNYILFSTLQSHMRWYSEQSLNIQKQAKKYLETYEREK